MLIRSASLALLALAATALAQPPGRGGRFGPPGAQGAATDARLIGAVAGNPRSVVKSAPYSADVLTESTQILPDGNRIRQTVTQKVYRDGEGRVRNEQSLAGLGALAPNSGSTQVVYINDPVAGVNYALDVKKKAATKSTLRGGPIQAGGPQAMGRGQAMGAAPFPQGGTPMGRGRGGPRPDDAFRRPQAGQTVKTESLGRQTVEGVPADGTRTTFTIAAGQIGNDQPLQIVSESWFSPDLQVVVLSRHSDPRAGETVVRLTNINRGAPAASLFQPPQDFTVQEAKPPQPQRQ
jgi:hypothetical protein